MQIIDERLAVLTPALQALVGGKPVDLPFDVEQTIDPFDRFQSHGRDRRGVPSTFGVCRNVGEHEELAPRVRPAQCLRQGTGIAVYLEQRIVTAIGIRLQNAGEGLQMAFRMLLSAVSRCIVECRRR